MCLNQNLPCDHENLLPLVSMSVLKSGHLRCNVVQSLCDRQLPNVPAFYSMTLDVFGFAVGGCSTDRSERNNNKITTVFFVIKEVTTNQSIATFSLLGHVEKVLYVAKVLYVVAHVVASLVLLVA